MAAGERFGRLLCLGESRVDERHRVHVLTVCDCGAREERKLSSLRESIKVGHRPACRQCVRSDRQPPRSGLFVPKEDRGTREIWRGMLRRCYGSSRADFKNYGAVGVSVCERWRLSFKNFLADMGTRPSGLTIDRIDPKGNYEPSNCRWVSWTDQANNRTNNVNLTHNGETMSVSSWANRLGVPVGALHQRLRSGWTVERTITVPIRQKRKSLSGRP
jgi:hypothetical protein